jgi:DNA-binding response OmpR family regulator
VAKILMVDDDQNLAETVKAVLNKSGYVVDLAGDTKEAELLLLTSIYEIIILDWVMPGMSGIEFLSELRRKGIKSRVVMLTGQNDVEDKITGLESGADDYVTKPFHSTELLSRIRAILRRPEVLTTNELQAGGLTLDARKFTATWQGVDVKLTKQEYQLLELLMRNKNEVLSVDAIVERAWSSMSESSSDTVRVHLSRLRKKIEAIAEPCPIKNVHGRGYVFACED